MASLLGQSLGYVIAKGVPGILSVVTLMAYTRLLSPTEYGEYSVTIATATAVGMVLFQWQRRVLIRWLPAQSENDAEFLGVAQAQFFALSGMAILLAMAGLALMRDRVSAVLVILGLSVLLSNAWMELNLTIATAKHDPSRYGRILGTKAILAIGAGGALVVLGFGAAGALLGLTIACVIAASVFGHRYWTPVHPRWPTRAEASEHLGYGLPVAGVMALTWVLDSSDRVMLSVLADVSAAGQYSAGYDLANFSLVALLMMINLPVQSIVISKYETDGADAARVALADGAELMFAVTVGAIIGLVLLADPVAEVVIGAEFRTTAKRVLPMIAFAAGLGGLKMFYFDLPFVIHKAPRGLMISAGVAAIVNIGLNLVLIPRFDVDGAVAATVIAVVVSLMTSITLGRRYELMPALGGALGKALVVGVAIACAVMATKPFAPTALTKLVSGVMAGLAAAAISSVALNVAGSRRAVAAAFARWGIQ